MALRRYSVHSHATWWCPAARPAGARCVGRAGGKGQWTWLALTFLSSYSLQRAGGPVGLGPGLYRVYVTWAGVVLIKRALFQAHAEECVAVAAMPYIYGQGARGLVMAPEEELLMGQP